MKKRILIVNKFYYRRGGDCVYALNLEALLKSKGHDVAVYAMAYPDNIDSEWSDYFASEVDFHEDKMNALKRIFGYGNVKRSFKRILDEFRPDVVHLNNIHSYLSPIVVKLASEYGAKVVWTMHDYKLICPSYSCLNRGKVCVHCINDPLAVVKNRCMKDSLVASVLAYAEKRVWNVRNLSKWTDAFICPSRFMAEKMKEGGFPENKLYHICNFVSNNNLEYFSSRKAKTERQEFYCYIGRLSREKGIKKLLKVAATSPYKLFVAGTGPMENELKSEFSGNQNIKFLGHQSYEEVMTLLSEARFSVIPSEWYENNPYSVIESLCCGTPVVGANIGGIPELLDDENGILFEPGNIDALKSSIMMAWVEEWDYERIHQKAIDKFSSERYYEAISQIYFGI